MKLRSTAAKTKDRESLCQLVIADVSQLSNFLLLLRTCWLVIAQVIRHTIVRLLTKGKCLVFIISGTVTIDDSQIIDKAGIVYIVEVVTNITLGSETVVIYTALGE